VDFEIIENAKAKDVGEGTVRRGSATCSCCGYTTPVASVRRQLKERHGGAADARLYCVVTTRPGEQGRFYRLPTERDLVSVWSAAIELERQRKAHPGPTSLVPDERLDVRGIRHTWAMIYGFERWGELFTPRQALALSTVCRLVREAGGHLSAEDIDGLAEAVTTCLSLNVGRVVDLANSLCGWTLDTQCTKHLFARQAIPMVWNYSEGVIIGESAGSWGVVVGRFEDVVASIGERLPTGMARQASAGTSPLPDNLANAVITDPPYYDAVPYAYLSDFFYVWLRRCLPGYHTDLLRDEQVPKDAEIVVDRPHELSPSTKDITFYERELTKAFGEGRRVLLYSTRPRVAHLQTSGTYESSVCPFRPCVSWASRPGSHRWRP
jgi:adenine-specific DNA methylase